ncbi:hypothetical protein, conserved [Leishmania donovani]|uniref:Uncharacterized protein n=1 Tax=Leishmania donovani TaxID=5661 RepID=E9B811_LEIDO|nr:hypothetical protein, conserved [Leishmania donovani]CBZ31384.1 hypothetical protein, conserved [Leishmania donovani]
MGCGGRLPDRYFSRIEAQQLLEELVCVCVCETAPFTCRPFTTIPHLSLSMDAHCYTLLSPFCYFCNPSW